MFEKAARLKLRFSTPQGNLSVEDLWELPLTSKTGRANLDDIAIGLNRELKDTEDVVSFVDDSEPRNTANKLRFEIVRHVIEVRKEENKATLNAKAAEDQKKKIMEIIAQKQDDALAGKSLEELQAMLEGTPPAAE